MDTYLISAYTGICQRRLVSSVYPPVLSNAPLVQWLHGNLKDVRIPAISFRCQSAIAALPRQDRPLGTLFQHRYAADILYRRSVVI